MKYLIILLLLFTGCVKQYEIIIIGDVDVAIEAELEIKLEAGLMP